jgi:FkbM family methyltransferase
MLKDLLKKVIKTIPINFTKNQQYDAQTKLVIEKVCKRESNCIDVGAHKGEVLDIMLRAAPEGKLFAFEPIPFMAAQLKEKYASNKQVIIHDLALSNQTGTASFNFVVTNPSYSGLIKRRYDRANEQDELITVKTELLDNILSTNFKIELIKIDVEGGEFQVLEGAKKTITRCKPTIIFEHGLGASDCYGTKPEQVFGFLTDCGLKVSLMKKWLREEPPFSLREFTETYHSGKDYYFIAYA